MKIILERAGVHECGVDGVAEKALVYSCKFFWFFFNDCKKNMKKRMNIIRLNIKVKKFKNFPDRVLPTTDQQKKALPWEGSALTLVISCTS